MGCWCDWRPPRWLRFMLPSLIFGIILWLYTSFIYYAQTLLLVAGVTWYEILSFHIFVWLLCASLAQCLLSQESFIPRNTLTKNFDKAADNRMIESKMNGEKRVCRKCRAQKPDRAHHCSTCRRCLLKMDHHCVYINKCIGFYNYKFFLQFLGWSAAACLYMSSLLFRYLLGDSIDLAARLYVFGKLRLLSPSLQIVLVFFVSVCLGAALFCFYLMHLYFTAFNYSTLEYCEKRREPEYINYYNIGIIGNFQQVFGTFREFPYWFIPMHSPSVLMIEGKYFPLNSKYTKED